MAEIAKCKTPGCSPVEQCRGKMGPGDYFGVVNLDGSPATDHHLTVTPEEGDPSRDDIRIACSKCHAQTGWVQPDLPNMPGVGRKFCYEQWEKFLADKDQKAAMIDLLRKQFGDEAVQKFFDKSL